MKFVKVFSMIIKDLAIQSINAEDSQSKFIVFTVVFMLFHILYGMLIHYWLLLIIRRVRYSGNDLFSCNMNQMRICSILIMLHPRSQSIGNSRYSLLINLESILNELISKYVLYSRCTVDLLIYFVAIVKWNINL